MTNTIKDFIDAADDNRTQRVMKEMYEALKATQKVSYEHMDVAMAKQWAIVSRRQCQQALTNVEQIIKESE